MPIGMADLDKPCSISPPGPAHPSSVRSAVRASFIIPKCENVPRGSERSYPGNGGTIIYHEMSVMAENLGVREVETDKPSGG